jgi:LmbE family N-acetylglucosaminyl deacetylase
MALLWGLSAIALAQAPGSATAQPAHILSELRDFATFGSVLHVGAHPDDENTQLLAYLARGRHYRTAYLSLTRGDGGQNLLGPEFGDTLGLIRTEELLAARKIDGARQFFTRARDFGFSKDYRQTLTRWDHQQVLSDTVRVIREFRPDVIITRFPPEPSHTHGHHTASAVIAFEAFRLSGDPKAFPEQHLAPWQAKHLYVNSKEGSVQLDIGGTDALTGKSFGQLAAQSRAMHKSQGFGNYVGHDGPHVEHFDPRDGTHPTALMEGVDTTWNRIPDGAAIQKLANQAIAEFNPEHPETSLPLLRRIQEHLPRDSDPVLAEKRVLIEQIQADCLGLTYETTANTSEVVPGETLHLRSRVVEHSTVPLVWLSLRGPGKNTRLRPSVPALNDQNVTIPVTTPLSQPYWLRKPGTPGMFEVENDSLIGRPLDQALLQVEYAFRLDAMRPANRIFTIHQNVTGPDHRTIEVIPPVHLRFPETRVQLFTPNSSRSVAVEVTASRPEQRGLLHLDVPTGWKATPPVAFHLTHAGDQFATRFTVTAPPQPGSAEFQVSAHIGTRVYNTERITIDYPHIPHLLLQPVARLHAVCLDLAMRGQRVGYLPGAGDDSVQALEQMGYTVHTMKDAADWKGLGAVVVGVRAANLRSDLANLWPYVEQGGTVVAQYDTPRDLKSPIGPYNLTLSRDLPAYRVTDEKCVVTLLQPEDPVFQGPNRIGPADFAGWVQERGLDFPSAWDSHYTPLLACSDPGEKPLTSGLLLAHYGKGIFVYTGLSFFRQLPAGVPGAYRLFANLVSLRGR